VPGVTRVNGTYWPALMIGATATCSFRPDILPADWGWRIVFFICPVLGPYHHLPWRRHIPEIRGWLMTHGRLEEAERTVDEIEVTGAAPGRVLPSVPRRMRMSIVEGRGWASDRADIFIHKYPKRTSSASRWMVTHSSCTTRSSSTYSLVLQTSTTSLASRGVRLLLFRSHSHLLCPLILGPLFRHRRPAQDDPRHLRSAGNLLAILRGVGFQRRLV